MPNVELQIYIVSNISAQRSRRSQRVLKSSLSRRSQRALRWTVMFLLRLDRPFRLVAGLNPETWSIQPSHFCLCAFESSWQKFSGKIFPFRCTNSRSTVVDTVPGSLMSGCLLSIRCENPGKETVHRRISRWHPPWILGCHAFDTCCTARLRKNSRICLVSLEWP